MKHIALLRSNPKDAGIIKILASLSKEYKVDCFIWDRQGDYQPVILNENITYRRCAVRAGFYNTSTIIKLFLFELWLFFHLLFSKIDFVHAIDLDTGFVGFCVAKLRAKKFVYQCLDPYYAALPKNWPNFLAVIAKRLENIVISHSDLFIISDLLRIPQHEGARPKTVLEIANVPYLNAPQFTGKKETGFLVGYIGTLTEGRNLTTIIEAVGELKDAGLKLLIGGFGPLEDQIKEKAYHYENIVYMSWVPYEKLLEIESTFDLFIHIIDRNDESQRWGSPNKLFESMAFGKPIIVGEGTLSERKVNSIGNGIAVQYGCKEELQRAILTFQQDSELSKRMGERGRSALKRNYSPEVIGRRLLEAYGKINARK